MFACVKRIQIRQRTIMLLKNTNPKDHFKFKIRELSDSRLIRERKFSTSNDAEAAFLFSIHFAE